MGFVIGSICVNISIHTLRVEGDEDDEISIHTLRIEGDLKIFWLFS